MRIQFIRSMFLVITATIWGLAFVAQSVGNNYVGPLTFTASRSILAFITLFFLAGLFDRFEPSKGGHQKVSFMSRWKEKKLWFAGIACGFFLVSGTLFQQFGLLWTTVGKASFISSLYITFVPIGAILFGKKPTVLAICAVPFALVGLFFLCVTETSFTIQFGDAIMLCGAFCFAGHILTIDRVSYGLDAIRMSCIQFLFCSIVASTGALIFETVRLENIIAGAAPILYAGILSSAVAYTLQIIGQRDLNPTVASLIMSLESVVGVLAGWVLLNQALTLREIGGCVLMGFAIVLAQLPDEILKKFHKEPEHEPVRHGELTKIHH